MKILITGATGYVGEHLIEKLIQNKEYDIYGVLRNIRESYKGYTPIFVDNNLEKNVASINPDIVIHLASYLTASHEWEDVEKLINTNILFSTRILHALRNTTCKYFINVGTFAEYYYSNGELIPTYIYAATKTAFRSMIRYFSNLLNFKVIHVIPYTIYGGNYKQQKVIDLLFQSLTAEEPIKLSDGFQQFDFIHIDDICSFFVTLINCIFTKDIKNDEVFHLGTGKPYSLREIASLIEKQSGKQLNIEWGATKPRERDTIYACASIAKNIHLLGWEAKISIEERLKTIDNF